MLHEALNLKVSMLQLNVDLTPHSSPYVFLLLQVIEWSKLRESFSLYSFLKVTVRLAKL